MAGKGFYINYKVPEVQSVLNNMSRYDARTTARLKDVTKRSGENIKRGMIRRIHNVSGYLSKHITDTFNPEKITASIRAKAPHSHLLEFGAKEVIEKPKTKKALTVDQFGNRNYANEVHIPERKEHPYARPALKEEEPKYIRAVKEAFKE